MLIKIKINLKIHWILLLCLVKNAKHDIIDVAKPRSLRLLRMVEPISPVEMDISVAMVELDGGADRPAGGGLTESEQVVGHADPVGFQ